MISSAASVSRSSSITLEVVEVRETERQREGGRSGLFFFFFFEFLKLNILCFLCVLFLCQKTDFDTARFAMMMGEEGEEDGWADAESNV